VADNRETRLTCRHGAAAAAQNMPRAGTNRWLSCRPSYQRPVASALHLFMATESSESEEQDTCAGGSKWRHSKTGVSGCSPQRGIKESKRRGVPLSEVRWKATGLGWTTLRREERWLLLDRVTLRDLAAATEAMVGAFVMDACVIISASWTDIEFPSINEEQTSTVRGLDRDRASEPSQITTLNSAFPDSGLTCFTTRIRSQVREFQERWRVKQGRQISR